jgi:hypothetical protein
MGSGEDFQFNGFSGESRHPQFPTIKRHIERAVQDLFLDSLRNKSDDLLYVFNDEKQIDGFVERILSYWEDLEDYEACKEVLELTNGFKQRWQERETLEDSSALIRIRELFKSQE